jgi:hypothetical protein
VYSLVLLADVTVSGLRQYRGGGPVQGSQDMGGSQQLGLRVPSTDTTLSGERCRFTGYPISHISYSTSYLIRIHSCIFLCVYSNCYVYCISDGTLSAAFVDMRSDDEGPDGYGHSRSVSLAHFTP